MCICVCVCVYMCALWSIVGYLYILCVCVCVCVRVCLYWNLIELTLYKVPTAPCDTTSSMLQCVAVSCSVLQHIEHSGIHNYSLLHL